MSDSPDNVFRFGGGGKLYQDARDADLDAARIRGMASADDFTPDPAPEPAPESEPKPTQVTQKNLPEPPGRDYREMFSTCLELTGVALLVTTGFLITLWLGTLIAGLCLILLGAATSSAVRGR